MAENLIKSAAIRIAIVTGICLIVSAILVKRVFHIDADPLAMNVPAYVFIIYMITKGEKQRPKSLNATGWSLIVIATTVIITGAIILTKFV